MTSAEIALVSYTLLILFRNTLTGLREVPEDARRRRGPWASRSDRSCCRVELPLALPAIMAGIRIATVTIISLATVAAFIGVGGLGQPIFNAIQSGFKTQFVAAGLLAVAAGAGGRRAARPVAAPAGPLGAGAGEPEMNDLRRRDPVPGRQHGADLGQDGEHSVLSRRRDRRGDASRSRSASGSVTCTGLVRGDQRLERRPRAAEPGRDLDRPGAARRRLPERDGRRS